MASAQLAKLSRPRLHDAVPRERIHRLLDARRAQPLVWVMGPPGSGKTTAVAGYVSASASPAIWYLLDRGDSDPATFFYYLGQAIAAHAPRRLRRLPLLAPEHFADLEGFARRFLRSAFARLPSGCVIVLDNFHEIAPDSALHGMLAAAVSEVPQTASLIVISRQPPPPSVARARLNGQVGMLDWDDLRLDPDETQAIAALQCVSETTDVATLHQRSGGWAAGARLLLESGECRASQSMPARSEALEAAFDYFAGEVFETAPKVLQSFLLRSAFLPAFTPAMGAQVTGDADAARHLGELHRRRLFVDRAPSTGGTYRYHDLFRAFLMQRASRDLAPPELTALLTVSIQSLVASGATEDAFELSVRAASWSQAEAVFLTCAPDLLAAGRWKTLAAWASALPEASGERNPWVRYWTAQGVALTGPREAVPMLEAAYQGFLACADTRGALMSAAAVVQALHFVVEHWDRMDAWLARLRAALATHPASLPVDDAIRVHTCARVACRCVAPPPRAVASEGRHPPERRTPVAQPAVLLRRCMGAR
jgi:ATP/maltotriose-dependent transcriptional regulator MalT